MSIEAMKQALEALERIGMKDWVERKENAITALRQAIQEEALRNVARLGQEIEQEPVAWMTPTKDLFSTYKTAKTGCGFGVEPIPLYTHPPKQWVGLTEKDFSAINQSCLTKLQAATSAESILKEKNG